MSKKDGGPAFPFEYEAPHHMGYEGQTERATHTGMTLRQYYKSAALTGLLANDPNALPEGQRGPTNYAQFAGIFADAMLAEDEEAAE